jgi:protein phosphatase/serine/threonine-protein phosphatase Stp1
VSTHQFRSWAATDAGAVRTHNEDAFVNRPDLGLWAVADGAGGHEAGEVASRMIADALEAIPPGLPAGEMLAQIRLRITAIHAVLREEAARRGPHAMIASTVVALIARDGHFACLWAGDSRAYLLRGGQLSQVTRDHSLVQELVDSGAIPAEEAESHPRANVITRAVGADCDELELDKVTSPFVTGDRFLLCSDGLSKTVSEERLAELLGSMDATSLADLLVSEALSLEASDNVTAVTVEALPE